MLTSHPFYDYFLQAGGGGGMAPYPRSATAQLLIVVVGMYGRTLLVSSTRKRKLELLKNNRCPVVDLRYIYPVAQPDGDITKPRTKIHFNLGCMIYAVTALILIRSQ